MADPNSIEHRIASMEADVKALRAEAAVYRGALVWLMGVHQLANEDQNPRRAILEPLGLALDFSSAIPENEADPRLVSASRDFIEAAFRVFLLRQAAS
jgi:hypothetical protein